MCFRHRLGWVFGGPQGVGCVFLLCEFPCVSVVGRAALDGAVCRSWCVDRRFVRRRVVCIAPV